MNDDNEVSNHFLQEASQTSEIRFHIKWIKEILSDAWVDTEMFKDHSTRAASTSATSVKGVSVNDIMAIGWMV